MAGPEDGEANGLFAFEVCFTATNGLFLTESRFLIHSKATMSEDSSHSPQFFFLPRGLVFRAFFPKPTSTLTCTRHYSQP